MLKSYKNNFLNIRQMRQNNNTSCVGRRAHSAIRLFLGLLEAGSWLAERLTSWFYKCGQKEEKTQLQIYVKVECFWLHARRPANPDHCPDTWVF